MKRKYVIVSKIRFTIFLFIMLIIFSFFLNFIFFKSYGENIEKEEVHEITVRKGDTLWKIANKYKNKEDDTRYVVYQILKLNKITPDIYPGQVIKIPKYNY